MAQCLLCWVEIDDSAFTICQDPSYKNNLWGSDTHVVLGNLCDECGEKFKHK